MHILKDIRLHFLCILTVLLAEWIGKVTIGSIVILPMLFAMVIGGGISFPKFKILNETNMKRASIGMSIVLMILVSRYSLEIGPHLATLKKASIALILQEVGHFAGTLLLGLPIAVALGMGREAIGATYSIGRENNIAIIDNKYTLDSAEGRGVMAMYIVGTVFGAIFISLLASFIATLDILNPFALAMGAGVGSFSMMTAGVGAIADRYPDLESEIKFYALTANILSSIIGMYMYVYISLPLAEKLYLFFSNFRKKTY
ncbi:DUF3100 domain-containing protein [Thorsellia anophelis]|uniref:DUF3100 domain-containing protein n=1 Tax=Thorsellia anophelis DSM 18579 TaxID=1123402 RepID=A0A1I0BK99_9GAMM|nr:DUF3100 domain-containing protein [Thorsellia anophelis]SET06996.1 Protein of unknown function [Thorsellia anophelis DSM 18579]